MIRSLKTIAVGLVTIIAVGAAGVILVNVVHGAFKPYYYLNALMPRAGQQLELGADVRIRGIKVGSVTDIELKGQQAELTLQLNKHFKVPVDTTAAVGIKTLLGEKFIDLQFDPHEGGPYLADGDLIKRTSVGAELQAVLADGTRVLKAVKPENAALIVSTLADAVRDEGTTINRGLHDNSALSGTFSSTTRYQIEAMSDFRTIFGALKTRGVDLNLLAKAVNEGVPIYASNEAAANLRKALIALQPFSKDLGDLLIVDKKKWDRLINSGDKVFGVLASNTHGIRDLVHGLYRYVYKLGGAIQRNLMPDGSASAGFTNFMGGNSFKEQLRQICFALPSQVASGVQACGGQK
jgi:virulence factor Mce-like protein